jgi:hypothetical protein
MREIASIIKEKRHVMKENAESRNESEKKTLDKHYDK